MLYSGFAHGRAGQPIDVTMNDLTFRFSFIDDGTRAARFATNVLSPKSVELQLFNFVSPIGVGLVEPIHLGQIGGRSVHLMFTVYGNTENPVKMLFCTFLQDITPAKEVGVPAAEASHGAVAVPSHG